MCDKIYKYMKETLRGDRPSIRIADLFWPIKIPLVLLLWNNHTWFPWIMIRRNLNIEYDIKNRYCGN